MSNLIHTTFSVATNFDNSLLDQCIGKPVSEFYGKLTSDFVGGGRSSYLIDNISLKKFEKHVAHCLKNGFGFNYLLNSACLGNTEITKDGQKNIRKLLDWLTTIKVTATTVSNPLLLRIIKKNYPKLRVRVSVFAGVDHVQKAKYWQDLGADIICLDSLTVNRDFKALKALKQNIKTELELLANNNCLQSCSLSQCHMNLLGHSSQSHHSNKGFVIDHCILECSKLKVMNPVNYIKSDWIRPEDINFYEELGYHKFKLVERNLPTHVMMERVEAYTSRKYVGNLLNLIQPYGQKNLTTPTTTYTDKLKKIFSKFISALKLLTFLRPDLIKVHKLKILYDLAQLKGMRVEKNSDIQTKDDVYIDNKLLDGFIERFKFKNCRDTNCSSCHYCDDVAKKVVIISPQFQNKCLALHDKIDQGLVEGEFFL